MHRCSFGFCRCYCTYSCGANLLTSPCVQSTETIAQLTTEVDALKTEAGMVRCVC
jgi:hypothetical protein